MPALEHLSHSSIQTYLQCPRAWSFRYREGVRAPSSPALVLGSALHGAVEDILRRRRTGQPVPLAEVWQEQWAKATAQPVEWGADMPEQFANDGYRLLAHPDTATTLDGLVPLVEDGVLAIERRVELRVPGVPIPVLGFIDLITADHVPTDFKTSSKPWTPEKAAAETQPLIYLAALNQAGHHLNTSFRFRHVVWVKGRVPQVQVIETSHTIGAVLWVLRMIRDVWLAIDSGSFPPNPGTWSCAPRWCSYWTLCRGKE